MDGSVSLVIADTEPTESETMSTTLNTQTGTRVLFLDDSGAPSLKHPTGAVVIGGLSIASSKVPKLSRRIAGAKALHFPDRNPPSRWELKATQLLSPGAWRRRQNRDLVLELVRILEDLGCTTYTASINKARMQRALLMKESLPMQIQRIVEHFAVECAHFGEVGLVVMDRSSDGLDAHTSNCVASDVASRKLPLHPVVYYVDSMTSAPTQVADLIAAARRRTIEGTPGMRVLNDRFAALRVRGISTQRTHAGYPWNNQLIVI